MVNQSFSSENFRRILDNENRRGVNLESQFFPNVAKITNALKNCKADFRELKKKKRTLTPQDYESQKAVLNETKKSLIAKKEELLSNELGVIAAAIAHSAFTIKLTQVTLPHGRKAFSVDRSAAAHFATKQLQLNLGSLYKVKQDDRYQIVCQLRSVLSDSFPKLVIRTDIDDFYESVSSERVLRKINEDQLLTAPSRRLINRILKAYYSLSGTALGVPRGVGVSPYLAELFIRPFDDAVKAHPDLLYYARYVDDIVAIFSLRPGLSTNHFLPFLENAATDLGLALNKTKTSQHDLGSPQPSEMEYLGYKLKFGDGSLSIKLSDRRIKRYESRINSSFDTYLNHSKFNEKKARKSLIKRIQFLTSNTRLLNNKSNILTGVFYSNSLLTSRDALAPLDELLRNRTKAIPTPSLRARLRQCSFELGFHEKRYQAFTPRELSKVVEPWKHEA